MVSISHLPDMLVECKVELKGNQPVYHTVSNSAQQWLMVEATLHSGLPS